MECVADRYERNIIVPGFGQECQNKLLNAKVIVVGAGGLGSAVLQYLAAAGIGTIGIVEFDEISNTNLQRQTLYTTSNLGRPKVFVAAERIMAVNPEITVVTYPKKLTPANAADILNGYHIVVDCTDNFETRYNIDNFCRENSIPMVYGTAQEASGQVSVFHTEGAGGYRSLYPESGKQDKGNDSPVGVLSSVPGIIGTIQAMEVIKLITGFGQPLVGKLLVMNAADMDFSVFKI